MYRILRKVKRHEPLTPDEKQKLIFELEQLAAFPNAGWRWFFEAYAQDLALLYGIQLPLFACDMDTVYDWLLQNPALIHQLQAAPLLQKDYPPLLADYLQYTFGPALTADDVRPLLFDYQGTLDADALPVPRTKPPTFKYEESNPYKEIGLKAHFERLARYSFVSRVQSYRYLSGGRAAADRFEVVADDTLSGIFTNKEKSIYYYIYLTERNRTRTENACRLLNRVFYGK